MKLFWLVMILAIYGFVFYSIVKETKPIFAHGLVNSDPFETLRDLARDMKGN